MFELQLMMSVYLLYGLGCHKEQKVCDVKRED